MMLQGTALKTGAAAVLKYRKSLIKQCARVDRFEEKYSLCRVDNHDHTICVPRQMIKDKGEEEYDEGREINCANLFKPRSSDQSKCVSSAVKLLDSNTDFILQAPTGFGKTYVGCALIAHLKKRTLVITTKEDIIDQWIKAAMDVLKIPRSEIGVWRGDHEPSKSHKVVIGLVQSVRKGPSRYSKSCYSGFGLVLVDEVHRMGAEQFSNAMWWLPARHRVGLSATPYRKDGRDGVFLGHIGPVLVKVSTEVMVPKIIAQKTPWKVPRSMRYGVYEKMYHSAGRTMHVEKILARHQGRNELICNFVSAAYERKRITIVFSTLMAHLEALHEELLLRGIPSIQMGFYVGLSNYQKGIKKEQKVWLREQAKIKPVIFATYAMASEATDIPWADTCVLGTPRADVVQIVGRIRREYEGKQQPVVYDLIDSDSQVFNGYWYARRKWYQKMGSQVLVYT